MTIETGLSARDNAAPISKLLGAVRVAIEETPLVKRRRSLRKILPRRQRYGGGYSSINSIEHLCLAVLRELWIEGQFEIYADRADFRSPVLLARSRTRFGRQPGAPRAFFPPDRFPSQADASAQVRLCLASWKSAQAKADAFAGLHLGGEIELVTHEGQIEEVIEDLRAIGLGRSSRAATDREEVPRGRLPENVVPAASDAEFDGPASEQSSALVPPPTGEDNIETWLVRLESLAVVARSVGATSEKKLWEAMEGSAANRRWVRTSIRVKAKKLIAARKLVASGLVARN